jgi:hypothetical protein
MLGLHFLTPKHPKLPFLEGLEERKKVGAKL